MLDKLAIFIMIVEKGGLAAAGRELGLSPASMSERLASLEAHYGVTLLSRTTRSISLTEEGRLLLEGARQLLSEAEELDSRIRLGTEKITGLVRLTAPVDLGQNRIVPVIDRFLDRHPDVSVDLTLTDGFVDLVSQGINFAVRYGTLADSTLKAKVIGENRRVVCAAPGYLDRNGTPQHPDDLQQHQCILMRFGAHTDRVWPFSVNGKEYPIVVNGRRVANNGEQVRRWALNGYGFCFKSVWDVQEDLRSGKLVEVLSPFSPGFTRLQIVYPQTRVQPLRVRTLMDMIAWELKG